MTEWKQDETYTGEPEKTVEAEVCEEAEGTEKVDESEKAEKAENTEKTSEEKLADAFSDLTEQLEKTAKAIGEQFESCAKKIDEHINSEAFLQKTENVKKASANIVDKAVDGMAKGTVLVSEGIGTLTGSLVQGIKKGFDCIRDAFNEVDSDANDAEEAGEANVAADADAVSEAADAEQENGQDRTGNIDE